MMGVKLIILLLIYYFYLISSDNCNSLYQNQTYPSHEEIEALVDFFNSTGGRNWLEPFNCGWTSNINNITYNPCSWNGISCNSLGHVIEIEFEINANIIGTLPNSLCNLTYAQSIILEKNEIYGAIPDCWSNASSIVTFFIDGGSISGSYPATFNLSGTFQRFKVTGLESSPFPDSWSNLDMIDFIILSGEQDLFPSNITQSLLPMAWSSWVNLEQFVVEFLTFSIGTIPTYFGSFKNLTVLAFFLVSFEGPIPTSILCLPRLVKLILVPNAEIVFISGIPSYVNASFTLTPNFFTSCKGLRNLPLQYIFMQTSGISGAIADDFGLTFPNLTVFDAYFNMLTGTIPSSICQMSQLIELQLNSNLLSGVLNPCFFNMASMEYISFASNSLSGTLPIIQNSGNCNLVMLSLEYNKLNGDFTSAFNSYAGCLQLQYVFLQENLLTGSLNMLVITQNSFPMLTGLVLNGNSIDGSIPSSFGFIYSLVYLMMAGNLITGTIPTTLCTNLTQISLSDNYISGPIRIPSSVTIVNLDSNRLSGTIPASLFSSAMTEISISNNCIDPSIPESVCNSSYLVSLNMNGLQSSCRSDLSRKTYEIPSCVWTLPKLQNLTLAGNSLRGTIPSIPSTSELVLIEASYNYFEGNINILLDLPNLQTLDFSNNLASNGDSLQLNKEIKLDITLNRLSGSVIQKPLVNKTSTLSILTGNIFSCSGLQDFDTTSYSCGSKSLIYSAGYFTAPIVILLFIIFVIGFDYHIDKHNKFSHLKMLSQNFIAVVLGKQVDMDPFLQRIVSKELNKCMMMMVILLLTLVVLVPLYESNKSRGFAYLFSWQSTPVYMDPGSITIAVFFFWNAIAALFYIWFFIVWCEFNSTHFRAALCNSGFLLYVRNVKLLNLIAGVTESLYSLAYLLPITVLLLLPSFAVNMGYVYSTSLTTLSVSLKQLVEVVASLIKTFIYYIYVPYFHQWLLRHFYKSSRFELIRKHSIVSMQVHNLLSTIIMPLAAVSLFNEQCFRYAILSPPEIKSTGTSKYCGVVSIEWCGVCCNLAQHEVQNDVFSTEVTYSPPFQYSYICVSSLVTIYVPLFTISVNISCTSSLIVCLLSIVRRSSLYYRFRFVELLFLKLGRLMPNSMLYMRDSFYTDNSADDFKLIEDTKDQVRSIISNYSTYIVLATTIGSYAAELQVALALCLLAELASFSMLIAHIISIDYQRRVETSFVRGSINPLNRIEETCNRVTVIDSQTLFKRLQNELTETFSNEVLSSIILVFIVISIPYIFAAIMMIDVYKGKFLVFWLFPWAIVAAAVFCTVYQPTSKHENNIEDKIENKVEDNTDSFVEMSRIN